MINNIFFDFDGVIADSVEVKTLAFRKLYESYGVNITNKVIKHHKENGGMSRFDKIKYYHTVFLNSRITNTEITNLADMFSGFVKQAVIESPEVPGSHAFIAKYSEQFNMFIITGTPTQESIEICKGRKLINYFKGVYGSPQKKEYWCNYIIKEFNLNPMETIFLGDAMTDYNAAKATNIKFYLREYEENYELFKKVKDITRFLDFRELENKFINTKTITSACNKTQSLKKKA